MESVLRLIINLLFIWLFTLVQFLLPVINFYLYIYILIFYYLFVHLTLFCINIDKSDTNYFKLVFFSFD